MNLGKKHRSTAQIIALASATVIPTPSPVTCSKTGEAGRELRVKRAREASERAFVNFDKDSQRYYTKFIQNSQNGTFQPPKKV